MKFEPKENMSRTEAAARLSAIADALGSDVEFELERGGEKLELNVPDQVRFELEVENRRQRNRARSRDQVVKPERRLTTGSA